MLLIRHKRWRDVALLVTTFWRGPEYWRCSGEFVNLGFERSYPMGIQRPSAKCMKGEWEEYVGPKDAECYRAGPWKDI